MISNRKCVGNKQSCCRKSHGLSRQLPQQLCQQLSPKSEMLLGGKCALFLWVLCFFQGLPWEVTVLYFCGWCVSLYKKRVNCLGTPSGYFFFMRGYLVLPSLYPARDNISLYILSISLYFPKLRPPPSHRPPLRDPGGDAQDSPMRGELRR